MESTADAVQSRIVNGSASVTQLEAASLEGIGRALADETRRRVLAVLIDGPAYPSDIAAQLGLGKANTSNHLSCLRGCGLVVAEPEGRRVRYELADRRIADGLRLLSQVMLVIDPDCSHA